MYIEHLEELRLYSHSMNITKTAKQLHISQPSLTKHIQQMEDELGFPLVVRGKQPRLTPAGRVFVAGIGQIIGSYDALVEQCRQVNSGDIMELVFQEPPMRSDSASARMYQIADELRNEHGGLSIRFTRLGRSDVKEGLQKRTVNLALIYEYGPLEETIARYRSQGYLISHVATEPIAVWCDMGNPLAGKGPLKIEDIRKYPVILPNTPYDPLRNALIGMCRAHGFEMRIAEYPTEDYADYLFAEIADEIYLLLACMSDQKRLTSRLQRVFVPFEGEGAHVESYLIMPRPANDAERLLLPIFEEAVG